MTIEDIKNRVAKDYGFSSYEILWDSYRKGVISTYFIEDYIENLLLEVQREAQKKIMKRVDDDLLNNNFDKTSIINENNLIK